MYTKMDPSGEFLTTESVSVEFNLKRTAFDAEIITELTATDSSGSLSSVEDGSGGDQSTRPMTNKENKRRVWLLRQQRMRKQTTAK